MAELNVSERTKDEMVKFFIRTSVPRIVEARKQKERNLKGGEENDARNATDVN